METRALKNKKRVLVNARQKLGYPAPRLGDRPRHPQDRFNFLITTPTYSEKRNAYAAITRYKNTCECYKRRVQRNVQSVIFFYNKQFGCATY